MGKKTIAVMICVIILTCIVSPVRASEVISQEYYISPLAVPYVCSNQTNYTFDKSVSFVIPYGKGAIAHPVWKMTSQQGYPYPDVRLQAGYTYEYVLEVYASNIRALEFDPVLLYNHYDDKQTTSQYLYMTGYDVNTLGLSSSISFSMVTSPSRYQVKCLIHVPDTYKSDVDLNLVGLLMQFPVQNDDVSVTLQPLDGRGTFDYTADLYQQQIVAQLEDMLATMQALQESLTQGFATNHSDLSQILAQIDLVLQYMGRIDASVQEGNNQIHQDLDSLRSAVDGGLKSLLDAINSSSDQSHQDMQELKESVEELLEKEKEAAESSSQSSVDDASEAFGSMSTTSLASAFNGLVTALNYTGTDSVWTLPAAHDMPFIGDLWDEQIINLNQYIDNPNLLPLKVVMGFVINLGLGLSYVAMLKSIVSMFTGGNEEE